MREERLVVCRCGMRSERFWPRGINYPCFECGLVAEEIAVIPLSLVEPLVEALEQIKTRAVWWGEISADEMQAIFEIADEALSAVAQEGETRG